MIVPVAERSRGGLLPLREEGSSAGTMSRGLDREAPAGRGTRGWAPADLSAEVKAR